MNDEELRDNMMHHYSALSESALLEQKRRLDSEYWSLMERLNIVRLGRAAVMTLLQEQRQPNE